MKLGTITNQGKGNYLLESFSLIYRLDQDNIMHVYNLAGAKRDQRQLPFSIAKNRRIAALVSFAEAYEARLDGQAENK